MIIFGGTDGATLTIDFSAAKLHCSGPREHFRGYKYVGEFSDGAYVTWAVSDKEVVIETDALGLVPYFIYRCDNKAIISDSLIKILDLCPSNIAVDWAALAVFLRLGHHIGDDTPFNEIKRLPANSIVTISHNRFTVNKKPSSPIDIRPTSLSGAIENYASIFDSTICGIVENLDRELIQPLSGGRDSRHILAALMKAGSRPSICVTQALPPPQRNDDVTVSKLICAELNLSHVISPSVKNHYVQEKLKNSQISYESVHHAWLLPISNYLKGLPSSVILDGLGGDILSESKTIKPRYYELIDSASFENLAHEILGNDSFLRKQMNKKANHLLRREFALQRLTDELMEHRNSSNLLVSFFLANRSRRSIAPSCWDLFGARHHVITPYLAPPVRNFLLSLPHEFHQRGDLHTLAIQKGYPIFRDYAYGGNGPSQEVTLSSHVRNIKSSIQFTRDQLRTGLLKPHVTIARKVKSCLSKTDLANDMEFDRKLCVFAIPVVQAALKQAQQH